MTSQLVIPGAGAPAGDTDPGALQIASNLSDLANASTARTNLGLGGAAVLPVGTTSSTVAAGNDSRITGAAQKASNLSDLASAATARTNLGLGGAAVLPVGTTSSTVAAGDDSRITGAAQKASNLSDLASASTARTNLGLGTSATKDVGTATGQVAAADDAFLTPPFSLTSGLEVIPRTEVSSNSGVTMTSQMMRWTYFRADKSFTMSQMRLLSGGTAAISPTLVRAGLYTIDGSGNLTLVAAIASDVTLFLATNTAYTRSLSTGGSLPSTYAIVRGTRYAFGQLYVGATAPTCLGRGSSLVATEAGIDPRLYAQLASQSDLPTSTAVGSLANAGVGPYAALIP